MRAFIYEKARAPLEKYMVYKTDAEPPKSDNLSTGSILVDVFSAALNPADYKFPEMPVIGPLAFKAPSILGVDYAGRVAAVGPDQKDVKVGDFVFGVVPIGSQAGSLADSIVVPTGTFAKLPDGYDIDQAAGLGIGLSTAWQALVPFLKTRQTPAKVFINGGAGGVGTFAIQLAKIVGAHVTTTCSTANVELLKSLGADEVIDYKSTDVLEALSEQGEVFDHVVDNVGTSSTLFHGAHRYMKKDAVYLQVGADISLSFVIAQIRRSILPSFLSDGQRKWEFVKQGSYGEVLNDVTKYMAAGTLRTIIAEKIDMKDTAAAYTRMRKGRTVGKVIVQVKKE